LIDDVAGFPVDGAAGDAKVGSLRNSLHTICANGGVVGRP
jgi:hypothetical protein